MANSTVNLVQRASGLGGRKAQLPVDGGSHIRAGTLVAQLAATAQLVPGSTASSGPAIAIATQEVDNSAGQDGDLYCEVEYDRIYEFENAGGGDAVTEALPMFAVVYMTDDHTVADNSDGGARFPAGRFCGLSPSGRVRVFVGMGNIGDALAAAGDVSITDAGGFTAQTDVEEALQEIYQDLKTAQAFVPIPIGLFTLAANGAPLIVFNDGVADGLDFSEGQSYRFNPSSSAKIGATVPLPQDLDESADIVVHVAGSRVGAADATAALTIEAFFQTMGAAHDADADAGGDTSAFDGATTVVTEETLAIDASDVPAAPCLLSLTLVPTAALDADDLRVHGVWLEYTRKILTA